MIDNIEDFIENMQACINRAQQSEYLFSIKCRIMESVCKKYHSINVTDYDNGDCIKHWHINYDGGDDFIHVVNLYEGVYNPLYFGPSDNYGYLDIFKNLIVTIEDYLKTPLPEVWYRIIDNMVAHKLMVEAEIMARDTSNGWYGLIKS